MGSAQAEKLSQRLEAVLAALKSGHLRAGPENIPIILHLVDALRAMLSDLAGGGPGQVENLNLMLDLADDLLRGLWGPFSGPEDAQEREPVQLTALRPLVEESQAVWLLRRGFQPCPARPGKTEIERYRGLEAALGFPPGYPGGSDQNWTG